MFAIHGASMECMQIIHRQMAESVKINQFIKSGNSLTSNLQLSQSVLSCDLPSACRTD